MSENRTTGFVGGGPAWRCANCGTVRAHPSDLCPTCLPDSKLDAFRWWDGDKEIAAEHARLIGLLGDGHTIDETKHILAERKAEIARHAAVTLKQGEPREIDAAKLESTLDSLERLHRIIRRTGGFMAHEDQQALREAEALLVAAGRSVPR